MQWHRFLNPWWLLIGAVTGGFAWAVGLPVWAAALIGVIIWLTTILVFGFMFAASDSSRSAPAPSVHAPTPVPAPGTGAHNPDTEYAHRTRNAAIAFEELAAPLSTGPLADWLTRMVWRANEIAASIDHLSRRSGELAYLAHTLAANPVEQEYAQYVQGRHSEVRNRMHAATGDLENIVSRFSGIVSTPRLSPDNATVEALGGELENIGYGVDIGEQIVNEILGPETASP